MKYIKYKVISKTAEHVHVQITAQSHRGKDFGNVKDDTCVMPNANIYFEHTIDGQVYRLGSMDYPQDMLNCLRKVWLRGRDRSRDKSILSFSHKNFEIFEALVMAYNEHFGNSLNDQQKTTVKLNPHRDWCLAISLRTLVSEAANCMLEIADRSDIESKEDYKGIRLHILEDRIKDFLHEYHKTAYYKKEKARRKALRR